MAILEYIGAEKGDFSDIFSNGGTASVQSATVIGGGNYSFRTNPATTAVGWIGIGGAFSGSGGLITGSYSTLYFSFLFRYTTKAASVGEGIFQIRQGTNERFELRLASDGTLKSYNQSGFPADVGSTVLSSGTTYRISGYVQVGTTANYEIKINGVSELSNTIDTGTTNFTVALFGKRVNRASNTVDYYYDDIILDDATEPGNYKVSAASVPIANGTTMSWTSGSGASNYTQVDEIPATATEYVQTPATANCVALFTGTTMATLGISGMSILAVRACIDAAEPVTVTSSNKLRIKSGATTTDLGGRNLTTTVSQSIRVLLTDPNTSAAWTETNVNALEFGSIEINAVAVRMDGASKTILYSEPTVNYITPSGGITPSGSLIKQDQKLFSGGITPSSSLIKQVPKLFSGSVVSTGLLGKAISLIKDGGTSPSGEDVKMTSKTFDGMTPSLGDLQKQGNIPLQGGITPASSTVKQTQKILVGAISPVSVVIKFVSKVLAGLISPIGTLISAVLGIDSTNSPTFTRGIAVTKTRSVYNHLRARDRDGATKSSRRNV